MKGYKPSTPFQSYLFPPSPHDWLPDEHLAYFMLDIVEELDISPIERSIQSQDAGYGSLHLDRTPQTLGQRRHNNQWAAARRPGPTGQDAAQTSNGTGREIYARRKAIVEPVNGQIKEARGFRRFLLRGLEKVRAEWAIVCAAHNLLKLHRGIAAA